MVTCCAPFATMAARSPAPSSWCSSSAKRRQFRPSWWRSSAAKRRSLRPRRSRRQPMSEDRENGQAENAAADQPGQEVLSEFFANFSGGGYKFIIFRKDPKTFVLSGQLR